MYAIRTIRSFYGPKTQRDYLRDEDSRRDVTTFATRAEAQAKIDEIESQTYHLSHNESGSPEYKIVRAPK